MRVTATTDSPLQTEADTVAIGLFSSERIAHDLPGEPLGALVASGEAGAANGRLAVTHSEDRRWLLVGLGDRDTATPERLRAAAARTVVRAAELRSRVLCWEVPHHMDDGAVAALVEGTLLREYRFDRYRPTGSGVGEPPVRLEELILSAHHDISAVVDSAAVTARAQNRVRDLGNRPANDLTPTALADYAMSLAAERPALRCAVLDESEIRSMGMGAFAAVSQGSEEPAKLIRVEYDGGPEGSPATALIGKAVTFDSGGLWLKPKQNLHEMKFDMCGGAAVLEAVATLADLQVPARVLGIVGATENMISGRATRPGDIVTALDGTTIEINNTDAEGRLVLADCITYARREGAARLIDIATLTGGVVAALGSTYAGLMSNDDNLAEAVEAAGIRSGERVWRLPLDESYAEMVKGHYAQITNLPMPRVALAITAAELLHHFAGDVPWAHLDIAGTAFDAKSAYISDKGPTGFGLRLLVETVRSLSP